VAIVAVAIAVLAYLWSRRQPPEPAALPPAAPVESRTPGPVHPLAPLPAETPLPPLEASDAVADEAATSLLGDSKWRDLLQPDNAVRRWVVTIDALPRERLAQRMSSVRPVAGALVVEGEPDALTLSPANFARYEPYVALAEAIDPAALVRVYRRLYPLLQQAYADLVRPDGYFNDRLIEVLDHLIAAPDYPASIQLVQPSVVFKLKDPELESLSVGRKALLRMGPDNARRVKAVLERLRTEIVRTEIESASRDQ
jgi:hypothetical protein